MNRRFSKEWAVLALSFFFVSCSEEERTVLEPRVVKTFEIERPSSTYQRVFSGQLQASEGTGIGFQVSGLIEELDVKVGSRIVAGEVLARLDDSDYQNQLADANAKFSQSKKELQRTLLLFEAGNASESQRDSATARNLSAKAAASLAERRVADCVLVMPYTGLIGGVLAEKRDFVNIGQSVISIQGEDGLEFEIGVPVDLVGAMTEGLKAEIEIGGRTNLSYHGTVTEISPQVAKNTTYPVTIAIEDEDDQIRAGMDGIAIVDFPSDTANLVMIPLECVVAQAGKEPYVWLVKELDGRRAHLERRSVVLDSIKKDGMIGVVSNLVMGDVIVSRGVNRVEAGMEVLFDREQRVVE